MPTIQELAAKLNKQCVDGLVRNVKAMPEDKATWQPLELGRTALDQLQECAVICGFAPHVITHHGFPADFNEAYGKTIAEIGTVDLAVALMEANSAKLNAAILAVPDSELDTVVKLPWSEEPSTVAEVLFLNYWNVVYHIGQVSYIQVMYGDKDMH